MSRLSKRIDQKILTEENEAQERALHAAARRRARTKAEKKLIADLSPIIHEGLHDLGLKLWGRGLLGRRYCISVDSNFERDSERRFGLRTRIPFVRSGLKERMPVGKNEWAYRWVLACKPYPYPFLLFLLTDDGKFQFYSQNIYPDRKGYFVELLNGSNERVSPNSEEELIEDVLFYGFRKKTTYIASD